MAHNYIADQDNLDVMARLRDAIKDSGNTLRGLERITSEQLDLANPERIQHGRLSEALNDKANRKMYLQAYLAICKVIGVNPVAILAGAETGLADDIMSRLPKREQREWLLEGLARLEAVNGPSRRLESLRQAAHETTRRASTTGQNSRSRRAGP